MWCRRYRAGAFNWCLTCVSCLWLVSIVSDWCSTSLTGVSDECLWSVTGVCDWCLWSPTGVSNRCLWLLSLICDWCLWSLTGIFHLWVVSLPGSVGSVSIRCVASWMFVSLAHNAQRTEGILGLTRLKPSGPLDGGPVGPLCHHHTAP